MLNKITHNILLRVIEKEIDIVKLKYGKAIIIDAAILIESGILKRCDKVWVVVADKNKIRKNNEQRKYFKTRCYQ